jgi:bile acid:Na+ symporter, BASS family
MRRMLDWFARLLALWTVLAVAAGYIHPPLLTGLAPFMDWFFAVTMFGIGCVLAPEDFAPVFRKPQDVLLGTLAQFVIMPCLAFAIAKLLRLPPAIALGLILAGAVPDAMAAGVMSYLAEADVALSVSLTTLTTLVSPVLTPLLTLFLAREYIPVDFLPIFSSIVRIVILPLLLGLYVKHRFREAVGKVQPLFPALSTLFIACICGLVVAMNRDSVLSLGSSAFAAVVLLNVSGLALGYAAAVFFRFDLKQRRTLAIGVGMQNAGLGAVLALKHFSPQAALPSALFATWSIISASLLAAVWGKRR